MTAGPRRRLAWGTAVALTAALLACGGGPQPGYRAFTDHYQFLITSDPMPPHAREKTIYKIIVRDKNTQQPIEGGEGLLYANTRDGARAWDSFSAGPEPGTYYATLDFVVASPEWAMGMRFRKDSTQKLEQADWMQEVLAAHASPTP